MFAPVIGTERDSSGYDESTSPPHKAAPTRHHGRR